MSLQGKIAVVTGASRGIGRAIAVRLGKDGAMVAVNFQKNAEAAAAVVREIEAAGGQAFATQGDVGSVAGIRQFFQSLDAELAKRRGSNQFDILVNNAGIGREGTVEATSEEIFDQLMAVNVKGSFFVAQAAIIRACETAGELSIFPWPFPVTLTRAWPPTRWARPPSTTSR